MPTNVSLSGALRVAASALVVAALVLVGVLAVPGAIGAESSHVVLSASMEPAIGPGDVVITRAASANDIEEGDVVVFRTDGELDGPGPDRVTHRVVERVQTADGVAYRTKGDANDEPDSRLVDPSQVVGEVWFHVPLVGHLVLFLSRPLGQALLVVVPGLFLVASGARTLLEGSSDED